MFKRYHCLFKGRVQGVGFRYTVQDYSEKYKLSGWVRNLPDGCSVEAEIQGLEKDIQSMTADIKVYFGQNIRDLSMHEIPVAVEEPVFVIKH